MVQKERQQPGQRLRPTFLRPQRPALPAAEFDLLAQLAVHVPAELQLVGQQQVAEGAAIAAQLLAPLHVAQRHADVLGLHIADNEAAAGDDEIGRAAGDALRLVGGRHGRVERFQQ